MSCKESGLNLWELKMNKGFAFFIPEYDKPMPDFFIPLQISIKRRTVTGLW